MAAVRFHELDPSDAQTGARGTHLRLVPPDARCLRAPAVYRWRRVAALLVVAVAMTLVAAAGVAVAGVAVASTARSDSGVVGGAVGGSAASTHVVQPGDTYWSIAQRWGGGGDVREAVDALAAANGGRALQVGDRLVLPG